MKSDPDPELSIEEQAARWKLRQLDVNKNNVSNYPIPASSTLAVRKPTAD